MKLRGHGIGAWLARISVLSMALLYLFASTQLGHTVHEWAESHAEKVVQKEAFACALHKCACKNALQCKVNCCCFPKAAVSDSHSHEGEDRLTPHWKTCGSSQENDHGLMPLSPHIQTAFSAETAATGMSGTFPDAIPRIPSPISESPFKVPI
jgi:hypothetical protein